MPALSFCVLTSPLFHISSSFFILILLLLALEFVEICS